MSDFFDKIESENPQLVAYVEAEMQEKGVDFGKFSKDFAITVTASLVSVLTGRMLGPAGSVSLQDEIIQSASINTYANGASYGTTIAIDGGTTIGDAIERLVTTAAIVAAEIGIGALGLSVGAEIIAVAAAGFAITALIDETFEGIYDKQAIIKAQERGSYLVESASDLKEFVEENWELVKVFHENGKKWSLKKDGDDLGPILTFSKDSAGDFHLETNHPSFPMPELFLTLLKKIEVDIYFTRQGHSEELIYNFTSKSLSELVSAAETKVGLFAMLHLSPYVPKTEAYNEYNDIDINEYSENYKKDRAHFLYHSINPGEVAYDNGRLIYFKDLQLEQDETGFNDQFWASTGDRDLPLDYRRFTFGTSSDETIEGGIFEDHLYGESGNDVLTGYDGDDYIEGGKGADTLDGGNGIDTFYVEGTESAYDTFRGGDGEDIILGSKGNDTIRVHNFKGDDTVEIIDGGGASEDGGMDVLAGTAQSDTIDLTGTQLKNIHEIQLGDGADTLRLHERKFDDTLDKIDGGTGEDTIKGISDDSIFEIGDAGRDLDLHDMAISNVEKYETGDDDDTLNLENAIIEGDITFIDTKEKDDVLNLANVSADNSTIGEILAGDGNNTIDLTGLSALSIDKIKGGSGDDTLTLKDIAVQSINTVSLGDGMNTITSDNVSNVGFGDISGGAGRDAFNFTGSTGISIDAIDMGGDYDVLDFSDSTQLTIGSITAGGGNGGSDSDDYRFYNAQITSIGSISAGKSHNYFDFWNSEIGSLGSITGNEVEDEFDFSNAKISEDLTVSGGNGLNTYDFTGVAHGPTITIKGGDDIDNVKGSDSVDIVSGGGGRDHLEGNKGNDELHGEDGEDKLYGGDGEDKLYGGNNNDTLNGGRGADTLEGGDGFDTYFADNGDTIKDSDHEGRVHFGGTVLSYGYKEDGKDYYEGNGGRYTLSGGTLTFSKGGENVTIRGYSKDQASLGIRLEEEDPEDDEESQDFASPLVLDLNDNAITSTSRYENGVFFDLDGDGFREKAGWIESEDGLLALDLDGSGAIESGRELFGNYTAGEGQAYAEHGFAALSRYDENGDGVMNGDDAKFSSLQVWIDADGDGVSQESELHTLESLDIESIDLNSRAVDDLEEFNKVTQVSTFTRSQVDENGVVMTDDEGNPLTEELDVRDVWFGRDNENTEYDFTGTISPQVAALPDMKGQGRVKNLKHAMAEDSELVGLAEQLLAAAGSDLQTLQARADDLLARWTHTDTIDPDETRGQQYILNHNYSNPGRKRAFRTYAYARDIAILESFDGEVFRMKVDGEMTDEVIGTTIAKQMADQYSDLRDSVVINLVSQSLLGEGVYDSQTGELDRDLLYSELELKLNSSVAEEKQTAVNLLAALIDRDRMSVFEYVDGSVLNDAELTDLLALSNITLNVDANGNVSGTINGKRYASESADTISGSGDLFGLAGNDNLSGGSGHDNLYGGDGDDVLKGGAGDDMLRGGAGNDHLYAGGNYGHDVLTGGTGDDILTGNRRSSSYVYHYGDGHDVIVDSGTIGNTSDVLSLRGIVRDDVTVSKEGNDMLLTIRDIASQAPGAVSGSIRIKNGFGGGKLERYEFENEVLDYQQLLYGSSVYDDTYEQNPALADYQISDNGGTDTLVFAEGITADMLAVKVVGENNVVIAVKEEGVAFEDLRSRITIHNAFEEQSRIERYVFADGTEYGLTDILTLQHRTDGDDIIRFVDAAHIIDGEGGNDVLITVDGSDRLVGGSGNDILRAGAGDDTYVYNPGDGHDRIVDSQGNLDRLLFGEGVTADDLLIAKDGDGIVIGLKEGEAPLDELPDTITVENWYLQQNRLERIEFADGSFMNTSDILSKMSASGVIEGLESDDVIDGSELEDIIFGRSGNDTIQGFSGADQIYGEKGDDFLDGGSGDDELYGGSGNDIYIFNRGSGNDLLEDFAEEANGGGDTIRFGPGIRHDDLIVRQKGNDLRIGLREADTPFDDLGDQLRIRNWFSESSRIESFTFADDSTLTAGAMLRYLGTEGNDVVNGFTTDSSFTDSLGDDEFHGREGNDTFRFGEGGGHDIVTDAGGGDSLVFASGITPGDVHVSWLQGSNTAVLSYGDNDENTITLTDWYLEDNRIEQIVFEDGTIWTPTEVIDRMGTEGDDVYNGLENVENIIHSRGGEDIVSTYAEDDAIYGGAGDDALDSRQGNDLLVGGEGADLLWGGSGDDTYLFNRGDGQDTIFDNDNTTASNGYDRLIFGTGIGKEDLVFKVSAENDHLVIGIVDPANSAVPFEELTDTVTINNWYDSKNRIELLEFQDSAEAMTVSGIMLAMGTSGDDEIKALVEGSEIDGLAGNDKIYGNVGADILRGGDGEDLIHGGDGHDTLSGNTGNDRMEGGAGDDIYRWEQGDGADTIYDLATETYYQYDYIETEDGYLRWGRKEMQRPVDGGDDTVYFGDSITPDMIQVKRVGEDAVLGIKEADTLFADLSDRLILTGYFNPDNEIETLRFADGSIWNVDMMKEFAVLGTTEVDNLVGFAQDDIMEGYAADDTLIGLGGDDSLTGGLGNDTLDGGPGRDTYHFSLGDGADVIQNYDTSTNRHDVIEFSEGITEADVRVQRSGEDLYLFIGDSGDRITVEDYFIGEGHGSYAVDEIKFNDGISWDIEKVKDLSVLGTEAGDLLNGFSGADHMEGYGGNDTISGQGGNDDIDGGTGDDLLDGGTGSDIYHFRPGDGQDVIQNYDISADRHDVIEFGDGIVQEDVLVKRLEDDLYLIIGDGSDQIMVEDFFNNEALGGYAVDEVRFASGSSWSLQELKELALLGTEEGELLLGYSDDDLIKGFGGNDTMHGMAGNDTILAGAGNDTVLGGTGNDTISGETGDDILSGEGGDDEIFGGLGNDEVRGNFGSDTLYGNDGNDEIYGGFGNDELYAGDGADILYGNDGEDRLYGGAGDDVLQANADIFNLEINYSQGGTGNDTIYGSYGRDVYTFNLGDGIDTIHETREDQAYSNIELQPDSIVFGAGINPEDLVFSRYDEDMVIDHINGTDQLTITNWFKSENELFKIESISFDGGLSWDYDTIESKVTYYGSNADDTMFGYRENDDVMRAGDGDDYLDARSGDDTLFGEAGNDQLDGGGGTNFLSGGAGNDKYVYRAGAGTYEIDNSDGGDDWLLFTDAITSDRLAFHKSGDDLIVRVDGDENHQVTVKNWFAGSEFQLTAIQPSGANGITAETINRMFPPDDPEADGIEVPADIVFDTKLYGTANGEQLQGTAGNDILRGFQGDDYLFSFAGDDWLLGGSGNDQLDGGAGNDMLYGGAGNDIYVFRSGYGSETIDASGGGIDWLIFDSGLTLDKLHFLRVDNDLVISVDNSDDNVSVGNWFLGSDYQIDYIQPDGGNGIPPSIINDLVATDQPSDFDNIVDGTEGDEQLVGTAGTDQLNGLDGADQLFGLEGNDELNGGAGDDYLDGGAGDDIQNGGLGGDQLGGDSGNDLLAGGAGDDVYVYGAGSGADTIDNKGGGTDWLIFSDDITSDRLSYLQSENDLIIRVDGDQCSQVTITDWFLGGDRQLAYIQPSGASALTAAQINDLFTVEPPDEGDLEVPPENTFDTVRTGTSAAEQVVGSNGSDLLKGLEGDDQLFALAGDDWLLGGDGADYFDGGAGNDIMLGGAGNDQLGGDVGNDIMSGGLGDDIYVYRSGSGSDTIINGDGGTDWLIFSDDITEDRLSYYQSGDDLLVKIDDSQETMVTVKDWFKGGENQIDYIQPAGGYGISAAQINTLVQEEPAAMAMAADNTIEALSASMGMDGSNENSDYASYNQNLGLYTGDSDNFAVSSDLASLTEDTEKTKIELLAAV